MNMTQIFVRVATFDCIKMSQWLSMHNTRALKSKSSFVEFSHCSFDYLCLGFFHSDVIMSRKKYGNKTGNILNEKMILYELASYNWISGDGGPYFIALTVARLYPGQFPPFLWDQFKLHW